MRVEMKAPVKTAHDNIVKLMAGKSTKVEIYQGRKKVKTYYVSDATKDNVGTYVIDGSSAPYICHIPGFWISNQQIHDTMVGMERCRDFQHRLPQIAEIGSFHQDLSALSRSRTRRQSGSAVQDLPYRNIGRENGHCLRKTVLAKLSEHQI